MSDNVSMSLDDYIKRQRKQTPKNVTGGAAKNQVKGKGKARNQTRYYQQAAGGLMGNRGKNVKGRPGQGPTRKRGRVAVNTPGGGGGGFQRKRGQFNINKRNNRLNAMGKNRPGLTNAVNLDVRARRFGVAATPKFNQARPGGAVRNQQQQQQQPRNKRNFKKLPVPRINNNNNSFQQQRSGRILRSKGNVRLQNLIKKRIKNARSLLASKVFVSRNNPRLAPTPKNRRQNIGLLVGRSNTQGRLLAQQKLNRAKFIRSRIRNNKIQRSGGSLRSRGLSVDRNNLVRVRVANDFRQNYGGPSVPPSNFHPASSMYSSSQYVPLMPPNFHAMADPEFPPFTMHNTLSTPIDEMEVCRSTLDPSIQRRISVIQNRARNSNMSPTRVMSDFKAPVSSSAMKLGDRFRMMMR